MQHTARTALQRHPERAAYDAATIYGILDAGFVCHVGFIQDGVPFVLPMSYGRVDDTLYLHGSPEGRKMLILAAGAPLCIAVTHVDGLVLARATCGLAANYRSVVILGHGRPVHDEQEKRAGLRALLEQALPGRSIDAREPTATELDATLVVAVQIEEASAKLHNDGPSDAPADQELDVWAGVVPLALRAGVPIPAPGLAPHVALPAYVADYRR